jgi:hypothetical protein
MAELPKIGPQDRLIDVNQPVTACATKLAGSDRDNVRVIDAFHMAVGLSRSLR